MTDTKTASQVLSDDRIKEIWDGLYWGDIDPLASDAPAILRIRFARAILAQQAATPAEAAQSLTSQMVQKALSAAWNEFVSDTGCYPSCFEVKPGKRIEADFERAEGAFLDYVTETLNAAIVARQSQGATEQPATPAEAANVSRLALIADAMIDAYKEHYDFPAHGESHMHDCIMGELECMRLKSGNSAGDPYLVRDAGNLNDSLEARALLNSTPPASADALAQQPAPACATCNDNGMIGGPSYYAPDEGGEPCPDCAQQPAKSAVPAGRREALYRAAINCPHSIDSNLIKLHYDAKQPGKNALAQLGDRLDAAAHAQPRPGVELDDNLVIEIGRTYDIHPDSALPFVREILRRATNDTRANNG